MKKKSNIPMRHVLYHEMSFSVILLYEIIYVVRGEAETKYEQTSVVIMRRKKNMKILGRSTSDLNLTFLASIDARLS